MCIAGYCLKSSFKPPLGNDVDPIFVQQRLAKSPDDATPTSGDDVGSTLVPTKAGDVAGRR